MNSAIGFVRPKCIFWLFQKINKQKTKRPPKMPKMVKNGWLRERFLEKYLQQNQSHGQTISPIDKWLMPLRSWDQYVTFGCLRKSKKSLKDPKKCWKWRKKTGVRENIFWKSTFSKINLMAKPLVRFTKFQRHWNLETKTHLLGVSENPNFPKRPPKTLFFFRRFLHFSVVSKRPTIKASLRGVYQTILSNCVILYCTAL